MRCPASFPSTGRRWFSWQLCWNTAALVKQKHNWGERQQRRTAERDSWAQPRLCASLETGGLRPGRQDVVPGAVRKRAPYLGQGAGVAEGEQPGNARHGPLLHGRQLARGEGQQELWREKLPLCPQHGALVLPLAPRLQWEWVVASLSCCSPAIFLLLPTHPSNPTRVGLRSVPPARSGPWGDLTWIPPSRP